MSKRIGPVVLAFVLAMIAGRPALAQSGTGIANASSHGKSAKHPQAGQGPQSAPTLPIGTRTTGAWLDDATLLEPGSSWVSLSWDDWRSPTGSAQFLPSTAFSIGMTTRVQVQASLPYQYSGASAVYPTAIGFGDAYVGAKVLLTKPAAPVSIAVTPTAEILTAQAAADGTSRVNWVLPVSAEMPVGPVRAFAAAGYFTRGAVFVGGGVTAPLGERVMVLASLSDSHPTGNELMPDGTPAGSQVDIGGGVYCTLSERLTVFGSVGRTISKLEADSTKSLVSLGVAVNLWKGRTLVRSGK